MDEGTCGGGGPRMASQGSAYFRSYQQRDLAACSEIAARAWPASPLFQGQRDRIELMRAYLEFAGLLSTVKEVICVSDRVVGFFFGRLSDEFTFKAAARALSAIPAIGFGILTGIYGHMQRPLEFLGKFALTELKVLVFSPRAEGEILLFAIDSAYRGQGLGTEMMTRFVQKARHHAVRTLALYTEERSNSIFYDKSGFKRCKVFRDNVTSFVTKGDVRGIIYTMSLGPTARSGQESGT
jgi:ribosomal protein S18 acetylase RimI-like enzyme